MNIRRIGLFGGTFDPPHFGHVAALEAAAASGRFDLIEVTVAGDPYHKRLVGDVDSANVRLAMARAAFSDLDLVEVSDREIRRDGPSYTIDTVRELLRECDAVDLIVGADLAEQLNSWH
ncbi:MAG TPA: adenylyltransferase/cytidyltransferase family protein, partial [Acidimicrobiales bacterium]